MHDDLAAAHAKIEAAREAIRSTPERAPLAEKLERMAAAVARIERRLANGISSIRSPHRGLRR